MIVAKPDAGLFLRWRDILKRLASHQSKLTPPRVRKLDTSALSAVVPVESAKRVAASCGWTEDQFKILFFRAGPWQRSRLEHGR